jgi:hypothetical protein
MDYVDRIHECTQLILTFTPIQLKKKTVLERIFFKWTFSSSSCMKRRTRQEREEEEENYAFNEL